MKIALLTLPFVNNYGGILQAYALKHFLELRGHSVCIIDRNSNFKISFIDILRLAKGSFWEIEFVTLLILRSNIYYQ